MIRKATIKEFGGISMNDEKKVIKAVNSICWILNGMTTAFTGAAIISLFKFSGVYSSVFLCCSFTTLLLYYTVKMIYGGILKNMDAIARNGMMYVLSLIALIVSIT